MFRVIGDVHGEATALHRLIANGEKHIETYIFIGDLVDRGHDSAGVVDLFIRLYEEKRAQLIVGNHDVKLYKAVKTGETNDKTVIETLRQFADHDVLLKKFVDIVDHSPFWIKKGQYVLVHGGFSPCMNVMPSPVINGRNRIIRKYRSVQRALFGEKEGFLPNGLPNRTYKWLKTVPRHTHVIIGHDYRYDEVQTVENDFGGKVTFIDTGAGKGGKLSFVDIAEETVEETLPLLTVMIGPSGAGKSTWAKNHADENTVIVSSDAIREELFGDFRDQSDNERVFIEFQNRVLTALYSGKKVIADATNLHKEDRLSIVGLVPASSPIRYVVIDRSFEEKIKTSDWRPEVLIRSHTDIFMNNLDDIMRSDDLPNVEVYDARH